MYPLLTVNLNTIRENIRTVSALCAQYGIRVTGVTKVFCAQEQIVNAYLEGGVAFLGDANLQNLKKIQHIDAEKWMLRIPAPGEAEDLVRYADASLQSEWKTLEKVAYEAKKAGRIHRVILMVDLGDLREGYIEEEELLKTADQVRKTKGLSLYGIGTNLTCFSFVQSDTPKLLQLVHLASRLSWEGIPMISGGNSATLDLMLRGGIPQGVNNLRLGESLLFGRERAKYRYLDGTRNDAFILSAEVAECKEKPSMPWGEIGVDSYGNRPKFEDRGRRKKVICAIGRQSIDAETMWPVDSRIEILGASSDHLMLDVTDAQKSYRPGDTVEFRLGYYATLRAFTSPYVKKQYISE